MDKPNIVSELSAQATKFTPNPLVRESLEIINNNGNLYTGNTKNPLIIDYGCGKLRHLDILRDYSDNIVLVDTKAQIEKQQKFAGKTTCMEDYLEGLSLEKDSIQVIKRKKFIESDIPADIIFSVNVLDVVLESTRIEIIQSISSHLKPNGIAVLIIPRNISSILQRCNQENAYQDGHIFKRGNDIYTFYRNFNKLDSIFKKLKNANLKIEKNLSKYRYAHLLARKSS